MDTPKKTSPQEIPTISKKIEESTKDEDQSVVIQVEDKTETEDCPICLDEDTNAVTVTEDELARIAAESTQQLQDIQPYNVQDDINQVLSSIQVTDEDRLENRNTMSMQLVLDDDDSNDALDEPIEEWRATEPYWNLASINSAQDASRQLWRD